jgi:hypothetical protein
MLTLPSSALGFNIRHYTIDRRPIAKEKRITKTRHKNDIGDGSVVVFGKDPESDKRTEQDEEKAPAIFEKLLGGMSSKPYIVYNSATLRVVGRVRRQIWWTGNDVHKAQWTLVVHRLQYTTATKTEHFKFGLLWNKQHKGKEVSLVTADNDDEKKTTSRNYVPVEDWLVADDIIFPDAFSMKKQANQSRKTTANRYLPADVCTHTSFYDAVDLKDPEDSEGDAAEIAEDKVDGKSDFWAFKEEAAQELNCKFGNKSGTNPTSLKHIPPTHT